MAALRASCGVILLDPLAACVEPRAVADGLDGQIRETCGE